MRINIFGLLKFLRSNFGHINHTCKNDIIKCAKHVRYYSLNLISLSCDQILLVDQYFAKTLFNMLNRLQNLRYFLLTNEMAKFQKFYMFRMHKFFYLNRNVGKLQSPKKINKRSVVFLLIYQCLVINNALNV